MEVTFGEFPIIQLPHDTGGTGVATRNHTAYFGLSLYILCSAYAALKQYIWNSRKHGDGKD